MLIIQIEKSLDGVLGIQTRGHWMVDADETTELWWVPFIYICVYLFLSYLLLSLSLSLFLFLSLLFFLSLFLSLHLFHLSFLLLAYAHTIAAPSLSLSLSLSSVTLSHVIASFSPFHCHSLIDVVVVNECKTK